ncbi:MAG: GNAT family N-acetyltransferase [Tabrizicola sp.]|nr:GNAT family N-acetyltransferase [Tabrizicola sp.]
MTHPEIRVRLRKPLPDDVQGRMALGISAGIVRMYGAVTESQPVMGKRQADRWLRGLLKHPHAWVIEADGALVGEARLDGLNPQDRRARLAVGLFNDRHLGLGIGRRAVGLLLDQAFGPLGLHRVDLRVLAGNERAIRCYRACGFLREGVERESARIGDEWHDDWIMAILEDDHRNRMVCL